MTQTEGIVYLVDDDPEVLQSTRWLLESSGFYVVTATDGEGFEEALEPDRPGCVILDIRMPGRDGLTTHEELRDQGWQIPVIFLTGHGDIPQAVRALQSGAHHFLEKPYEPTTLIETVQQALDEDRSRHREERRLAGYRQRLERLTPREREVARYIAAGFSSKEAARELDSSPRTVEVHRRSVLDKLEVTTTVEVVHVLKSLDESLPERSQ